MLANPVQLFELERELTKKIKELQAERQRVKWGMKLNQRARNGEFITIAERGTNAAVQLVGINSVDGELKGRTLDGETVTLTPFNWRDIELQVTK